MGGYRLTPKAREGLHDILEYVDSQFGASVADQVLDRLVAAFEVLAGNPAAGHRREDLTDDARRLLTHVLATTWESRFGEVHKEAAAALETLR